LWQPPASALILNRFISSAQYDRWNKAHSAAQPVEIVTLDEAKNAEKSKSTATKTWVFEAKNVRDFAFNIFPANLSGTPCRSISMARK
jgi:hypothetical protein